MTDMMPRLSEQFSLSPNDIRGLSLSELDAYARYAKATDEAGAA